MDEDLYKKRYPNYWIEHEAWRRYREITPMKDWTITGAKDKIAEIMITVRKEYEDELLAEELLNSQESKENEQF